MRGEKRPVRNRKRLASRSIAAAAAVCRGAVAATASLLPPRSDDAFTLWGASSAAEATAGLAPECSYEPFERDAPNMTSASSSGAKTLFPRGRYDASRTYVGLRMWNSRGEMDIRRAILAMLGDEYAFYETPLFTAYKLLALGRAHLLPRAVRPSSSDDGWPEDPDNIHGYNQFFAEATAAAYGRFGSAADDRSGSAARQGYGSDARFGSATGAGSEAGSGAGFAGFPAAATEAEAIALAKALVDDAFDMEQEQALARYLGFDFVELGFASAEGSLSDLDPFYRADDPYFLLFSMLCYRKAASLYGGGGSGGGSSAGSGFGGATGRGPALLVLAAEARQRGLDLAYFRLQEALAAGFWAGSQQHPVPQPLSAAALVAAAAAAEPGMCSCGSETDFTEIITPGYHLPRHILGIEQGEFAFYKVSSEPSSSGGGSGSSGSGGSGSGGGGDGDAPTAVVVCLRSGGRCVTQLAPDGPFFFCSEEECPAEEDACGPAPLSPLLPLQQVPAVAALYAVAATADAAARAGAAAAAAAALRRAFGEDGGVAVAGAAAAAADVTAATAGLPRSSLQTLGLALLEEGLLAVDPKDNLKSGYGGPSQETPAKADIRSETESGVPAAFWVSLRGLRFIDGSAEVAAVVVGPTGELQELGLGARGERPRAADVLRHRGGGVD